MNMGERLRELRLRRKISQEEVARNIGITRSAYSHYEINNRQPVYDTLIKLAVFFDVSLDYIIGGTQHRDPLGHSSPDSRELLNLFRSMNQEQRQKSLTLISDFMHQEDSG
ncbi:helix-turn-helix transcriptional regulator [Cohnella terricola]|uniref:Helix-turn-helix transcriptional regulator n=2 Tax=Cohnella terricola TaxID=1289167 RepID=A0A559JR90_9BACL|nr:helix-turn-helix domain-containing protein [Cohnella terricola]TVY02394.1 helix-turn-helix transcriptional regulator [Cohnella terricola]